MKLKEFLAVLTPKALGFHGLLILFILAFVSGCGVLNPTLKHPDVKLVGMHVLPAKNLLQQRIALDLSIANPNKQDLNIRSMTYQIGIENINLLSGSSDAIPTLKGTAETPVTLELNADMFQVLKLIEHFGKNGLSDKVNYHFTASLDFSAWLPTMHVDKQGAIPLNGKNALNK